MENLLLERDGPVAIVTVNRPRVMNALNVATLKELRTVFEELAASPDVRAVILTGAGEKSFVAGADIEEIRDLDMISGKEFAARGLALYAFIEKMRVPVIAAVNGLALGAGCDLAIACDIVLASEKALFGEPPTGLGITTPFGGTQRLPRIVGPKRAKQLFFTGESIDAEMALKFGLVNKVVKHEELISEARKFAGKILERAPLAVGYCKRLVNFSSYGSLEEGDKLEAELYARCFDTEDKTEGMRAFLEKRKPTFKGK